MNFSLAEGLRRSVVNVAARLGMYQNRNETYLDYLYSLININKGMYILDVGGGNGDILSIIMDDLKQKAYGVVFDINLEALKRGKKTRRDLEFVLASAENMPFKNNSFDLALIVTVLEYLSKPSECTKDLFRIIKGNGFVFVIHPNLKWFIEPLTKWPVLSFLPKIVQRAVMSHTPMYTHVNLKISIKNIVRSFLDEGFIQMNRFPIYHSNFMKFLVWPPSWRIYFQKKTGD